MSAKSSLHTRLRLALQLVMLAMNAGVVLAQATSPLDKDPLPTRAAAPAPATDSKSSVDPAKSERLEDREQVAREFVQKHHPELLSVLDLLQSMKPREFEKAIRELAQTRQALESQQKNDPERAVLTLEAWKCRSRLSLLTANLARGSSPDVLRDVREQLDRQVDIELKIARLDRARLEERRLKLEEQIDRLETQKSSLVENRFRRLVETGRGVEKAVKARVKVKPKDNGSSPSTRAVNTPTPRKPTAGQPKSQPDSPPNPASSSSPKRSATPPSSGGDQ